MTSQIQDKFIYQNNPYTIIGVNGYGLFSSQMFDMSPIAFSTACRRGYYSEYSCVNGALILSALTLRLEDGEIYKNISGISPSGDSECFIKGKYYAYKYSGLKIKVPYSGGLLIARDFIEKVRIVEVSRPYYYKEIIEFVFEKGNLVKIVDQSEMVEAYRRSSGEILFSLEYDLLYANHIEKYTK